MSKCCCSHPKFTLSALPCRELWSAVMGSWAGSLPSAEIIFAAAECSLCSCPPQAADEVMCYPFLADGELRPGAEIHLVMPAGSRAGKNLENHIREVCRARGGPDKWEPGGQRVTGGPGKLLLREEWQQFLQTLQLEEGRHCTAPALQKNTNSG